MTLLSNLSPEEAAIHLDTLDSTQDEQPGSTTSMSEQPASGSSSSAQTQQIGSLGIGQLVSELETLSLICFQLQHQAVYLSLECQRQTKALRERRESIDKLLAWAKSAGPEQKTSSSK
jgi:hypothetical protein